MRMTPRRLATGMSLWVPNLFSGIRVKRFAPDWTSATVELHVNLFTRNDVKTAFGGSMSAMTDPYYFMLVNTSSAASTWCGTRAARSSSSSPAAAC